MKIKDVLQPFTAWKNLVKEPITIGEPHKREGAPRYRGFHQNSMDKCIGCGTCEDICQNAAIDMVPVEGQETTHSDSGLRPKIDYGRCCWCALCVDICTTGSLTMSNEFKWVEVDPDAFRFIPGADKKPWDDIEAGYDRADHYELHNFEREDMVELAPEVRDHSFVEIVQGYSKTQAQKEADRCVECGICVATCPAHMGIPDYIRAIREDDIELGLKILYETNPLPEVCGRICTHNCEAVCSMKYRGDAISIRWLKRYIADQVALSDYKGILNQNTIENNGKKVAVIGSGPAGLSAAYYLALLGYGVKIFEAFPESGGMMRYGIPEYRLPYDQIDKDVDYILSLGVEIEYNTRVGKDITLETLQKEYDAIFAGTGLHIGRKLPEKFLPGSDHEHVFAAADLLREVTMGQEIHVPKKVAVIGGGNVAMDISRTIARLQKVKYGKVQLTTTALETEEIMPADREEIVESREEGIVIMPGWGPVKVETKEGKITGLHLRECISVFDETGRFGPKFNEDNTTFVEADMIVESIGQGMDISYTESLGDKLEMGERGKVKTDGYYQSSLPWLFIGGDIVQGPDVIHGIANGHLAAKGIDKFIRGEKS
ncbi:FAD-dependent oxidoreductase [bacterium]|nr:FAD-dependent oxidoreductase [bacterium]